MDNIENNQFERQLLVALAKLALIKILSLIRHRHSVERHQIISELVNSCEFFWLSEKAELDPYILRTVFRNEIKKSEIMGKIHSNISQEAI